MTPVQLIGGTGSPYTQKMLALLRYRRIPYAVTWGDPGAVCDALGVERPRPTLMPTFLFDEDGATRAAVDSTPIIRQLEQTHSGRAVLPTDPALAFIDYLLEDFADEWGTKYMFHYRWHPQPDADNAARLLPLGLDITLPGERLDEMAALFAERQVGRLYVVGSNAATAPVIDASYRRLLQALEAHLANQPHLLGRRPGAGDFALYGQLTQLVGFDPTPRAIAHELSPRAVAWVGRVADLSGLKPGAGDWLALEAQPDTLRGLLQEVGRVYAPAQLANARALAAGEKEWECEIDGVRWAQQTFPYQAKCLQWTREQHAALGEADRARVDAFLSGTGVEAMLGDG